MYKEPDAKAVTAFVQDITKENLDKIPLIIMPVCLNQHWILLAGLVKEKKWLVHDSLHNPKRKDTAKKAVSIVQCHAM